MLAMSCLKWLLLMLCSLCGIKVPAQELKCQVEVNVDMVERSSRQAADALQSVVSDYMNTTRFSNMTLSVDQRIECRLFFDVKDYIDGLYNVDLQIQSTRPVYNSTYSTPLINLKDRDISFVYRQGDHLQFSKISIENQLAGILDFYAYMILAMDADSFALRGGDEFFNEARRVVQMQQSQNEKGWNAAEKNSRGAMLMSWTDQSSSRLRDVTYSYHRRGLDNMADDVAGSRAEIARILMDVMPNVYEADPMGIGLTMWRDSKLEEIAYIYANGDEKEKSSMAELLETVYPAEIEVISRIKK